MVEVEFLKALGIFKKGQVMELELGLANDLIRYNKGTVQLKQKNKKKSNK